MSNTNRKRSLRNDVKAVSPVIGVILMVAITVVLAAVVFVLVKNLSDKNSTDVGPTVGFQKDSTAKTLIVVQAPTGIKWSDVTVTGCTKPVTLPVNVTAGDKLTACNGSVTVTYIPSNSLLYQTAF